jgi:hypothetical protein
MDRSSLIVVLIPIVIPIALFTGMALPFVAASRTGRSRARRRLASADARERTGAAGRKARPQTSGAHDDALAGYLYVPCVHNPHNYSAGTRRWVQQVPIVKKTAKLIYYTSDSWDRSEAVVSPGCISREQFETDTRCRDTCPWEHCPHGEDRCSRGYPAGVIPVPGHCRRPGPAGRLFFATRQAAEDHLHRREGERALQALPQAPLIKELRRAMADAHPDRGGTAEQFIQALRRYQTVLRAARG